MLKNITKKSIITKKTEIRSDILGKAIGLMFSKKRESALIFVNRNECYVPLHMFFVFYPIDVLYVNSKKEVVEIKSNFKPFTFYHPTNPAKYVIELPFGAAKKSKTNVKDRLTF